IFLTPEERAEAPRLYHVLTRVRDAIRDGNDAFATLERDAAADLDRHGWKTDYVAVRRQSDLQAPSGREEALVVLGASRLGLPRLIDNVETEFRVQRTGFRGQKTEDRGQRTEGERQRSAVGFEGTGDRGACGASRRRDERSGAGAPSARPRADRRMDAMTGYGSGGEMTTPLARETRGRADVCDAPEPRP
ncbi:MAG: pantoate--beta-alanine ligase, partial [Candidatus Accumulibacter sp.]|nr:pantoate--beta-alanine ligase [Accumulibacter sp.]